MYKRSKGWLASACGLMLLSLWAHAETADRDKPINIQADTVTLDMNKGTRQFIGNVLIVQGTLRVQAERIDVTTNDVGDMKAVGVGRPVQFRQKQDNVDEYVEGYGDRMEYDSAKNQLQLLGNARVKRGLDEVKGSSIFYDSVTQQYSVKGGASTTTSPEGGGRVTVTITPKPRPAAPAATPTPAPAPQ
ncbi:lipopolysaccharide transport periplasmic protein LptA [Leeia sp.]|uniref:lipopolysaccharide transport periplasmic protein LptA n=1 Tax=Leeia sp. TaxID=2884678 RepID=UPI0035AD971E